MERTWGYGEDGYQAITFEYVSGGVINIYASGYDGYTEISRMPFDQLSEMYGAMLHFKMAEELAGLESARQPCTWPSCLTEEQGKLLGQEIYQEEVTGEHCNIYLERYPFDQREICGCREVPRERDDPDEL